MPPLKIAFGYKAGVGKDTAVNYLVSTKGGTNVKFSSGLYELMRFAQNKLGFTQCKDREFLQTVGMWARGVDEDIWTKITQREIKGLNLERSNIFISDVRFRNEFQMLKEEGFYMVKIIRENENMKGAETGNHVSETSLDFLPDSSWDHIIYNDGSITDFYNSINEVLLRLVWK